METMVKRDNYELSLQAAQKRFCSYDIEKLPRRKDVLDTGAYLETVFFGKKVLICKQTGSISLDGQPADYCETLSILDWLCDSQPSAVASGQFCTVSSLPGVLVSGSGLTMKAPSLAKCMDCDPSFLPEAARVLGGKTVPVGDMGIELEIFPGLPMQLKFYHSDEEFPADITFLWDRNILQFVRYETVYYIVAALVKILSAL